MEIGKGFILEFVVVFRFYFFYIKSCCSLLIIVFLTEKGNKKTPILFNLDELSKFFFEKQSLFFSEGAECSGEILSAGVYGV